MAKKATAAPAPEIQDDEDDGYESLIAERAARARAAAEAAAADDSEEPIEGEIVADEPIRTLARPEDVPYVPDRSQEIDDTDVTYPRLKLTQQMSAQATREDDPARLGDWYVTQDEINLGKEILIVPLSYRKHRSFFVTGQGLTCRSVDMNYGVGTPGDENRANGIKCDDCPLAQWPKERGTGSPPCRIGYNYLVLARPAAGDDEDWVVALLTLSGSSATAGKQLNGMWSQKRVLPGMKAWYSSTYKLFSTRETNAKGTFAKAKVERIGKTDPAVIEIAQQFAGLSNEDFEKALDADDAAA